MECCSLSFKLKGGEKGLKTGVGGGLLVGGESSLLGGVNNTVITRDKETYQQRYNAL